MSTQPPAVADRRQRRRRETFEAIEAAAWRLFVRNGYDGTTVDDIADAAGVSQRTFFRYFETKDAVMFGPWRERLAEADELLRSRPRDEPPMMAIAATVAGLMDRFESERPLMVQRRQMAEESPHAGRYHSEVVEPAWVEVVSGVVADRLGVDPVTDVRPRLFARTALAAMIVTIDVWLDTGSTRPLGDVYRETLSHLAQASDLRT